VVAGILKFSPNMKTKSTDVNPNGKYLTGVQPFNSDCAKWNVGQNESVIYNNIVITMIAIVSNNVSVGHYLRELSEP